MSRWPAPIRWTAREYQTVVCGRLLSVWTNDGGKTWWNNARDERRCFRTRAAAQRHAEKWAGANPGMEAT